MALKGLKQQSAALKDLKPQRPQTYGKQFITAGTWRVRCSEPIVEKIPEKKAETDGKAPETKGDVLPPLEEEPGARRKSFREMQVMRLKLKALKAALKAEVPFYSRSSVGVELWLGDQINGLPTWMLPFLDVGKKTVHYPSGTKSVNIGTRTIREAVMGGIDIKESIYEDRTTYESSKEVTLRLRFSRTLKLAAAVAAIYAISYFTGLPPPHRYLSHGFNGDMASCKYLPQEDDSQAPVQTQPLFRQMACAEKRYRERNK